MKKTLKKIMILVCELMLCQSSFSQMSIKIERLCTYVDDSSEENNAYLEFPIVSCKDSLVMEKINTFLQLSELNLLKGKEKKHIFEGVFQEEDNTNSIAQGKVVMNYNILSNTKNNFSFKLDETYQGATIDTRRAYYNFNPQNGDIYYWQEFFDDTNRKKFIDIVSPLLVDLVNKYMKIDTNINVEANDIDTINKKESRFFYNQKEIKTDSLNFVIATPKYMLNLEGDIFLYDKDTIENPFNTPADTFYINPQLQYSFIDTIMNNKSYIIAKPLKDSTIDTNIYDGRMEYIENFSNELTDYFYFTKDSIYFDIFNDLYKLIRWEFDTTIVGVPIEKIKHLLNDYGYSAMINGKDLEKFSSNSERQLYKATTNKGKEFYFTYYKTYYIEYEKKQYYYGLLIMKDKGTFYDLSDGVEENGMIVFDFKDEDNKNKGKFALKREGNKVSGIKTKKNNKQQFSFLGKKM